jgi:hypothetical protein
LWSTVHLMEPMLDLIYLRCGTVHYLQSNHQFFHQQWGHHQNHKMFF